MKRVLHPIYGCAALGIAATVVLAPAPAPAKEMFEGKTIRVVIGYAAGGGYDRYARQVARHIGRHLPGNPTVITQNMPGAGSVNAANYLYLRAPKDGTQFGTFARSLPVLALAGKAERVRYDPLKLTWIGTASSYRDEAYLMVVRKDTGINSVTDLRQAKETLNFASTSMGSDGTDVPIVLRAVLGLNIQPLLGYPGGNTLYLAVDRGEAQGRMTGYASIKTAHPEWLAENSPIRVVLQFGRTNRHPDFPDVPTALELARSDADRDLIDMMQIPFFMARPFAGPPDIPADRVKALRAGFMAAHEDPKYKAEAQKLRLLTSPMDGADVHKVVERLARMPRSIYDRYSEILENPKAKVREVKWQIVSGKITKVAKKGRFEFAAAGKTNKSRMTSGYTKLTVDGKSAKTKAVKVDMACKIWWEGPGSYAGRMECTK